MFIPSKPEKKIDDGNTIRIVLPFKDQIDPFHVYVNEVELEDKTITRSDV